VSLEIFLLGQFKLTANNLAIELPSRPAQSLLAYMALNAGVSLRREKLASLLWYDATEANARSYLRQALWRIRKSLESGSLQWGDYLQISEISITFNEHSDYWLDVDQLLERTEGRPLEAIIEDVGFYRGELLPGFYDEWVSLERDRLLSAYHQKMNCLLERLIQSRRWDEVIKWGEDWIRLGFSPEPAYRALLKAYAGLGNQGMISITYQRCKEALDRDLGVDPSPGTVQLYEQIQAGELEEHTLFRRLSLEPSTQPPFISQTLEPRQVEKPPFVARERELEKLDNYLNLTSEGQGKVVFVTGEAGSGKTSLITDFTNHAQLKYKGLIVASGNCNAHTGIGDPYLPFREILELLTGGVESLWLAGALTREYALFLWDLMPVTVNALMNNGPDLFETFVSGSALSERAAAHTTSQEDWLTQLEILINHKKMEPAIGKPHQSDLFVQYSKVLQILAREAPLVLIVDDLQWADLGSISLLFHLGRHLAGSRILILCAFRPEEVSSGRGGERHPLEPLINELQRLFGEIEVKVDLEDNPAFIGELLDSEPNELGNLFREMLFQLTRGHPLFTIELLRGMQERGDITKNKANRWVEGPTLDWDKLPARVEAVIAERVGRLDQTLQSILRTASVEGELFTAEVIARVLTRDEDEVLDQLSNELDRQHRLIRAHSIQRFDGQTLSTYYFRHILVQKYLYNSLDEVERVHLHEKTGHVLESFLSTQPAAVNISLQLARHFHEAGLAEKAINYFLQSAERALQVSAYQEAVAHLERGLILLATLPDPEKYDQLELSLNLHFGTASQRAEGITSIEAERSITRAYELCMQIGNTTQLCQITTELWIMHYVKGDNQKALEFADQALEVGLQSKDPLLIALGHWGLGVVHYAFGDYTQARDHLEQIISYYEAQQHHRPFVRLVGVDAGLSSLGYLACCLWCLGYPDQALKRSQEALERAHEIKHAFSLVDVVRYGGCEFHLIRREADFLKVNAEELILLAQEKNLPGYLAAGKYCLGGALILLDQFQEGLAFIKEGVEANKAIRLRCSYAGSLCYLAEVFAEQGELDQGEKIWKEALKLVEQTGERQWEAELYRVRSILDMLQGNDEKAEDSLVKALEIARQQNARSWELRAAIGLAHLWQKQGKANEARQVVNEVYSWFSEGFDTPELQEARELCSEIL
jgi:predicted ATPase/DNA-binding SARP family transcriptional activator